MIEAMKLALEALKRLKAYGNVFRFRQDEQNPYDQACEAIAILRTAIEQAEKQQALDKKAENARELGLNYEPVQADKQEPVAWMYDWTTSEGEFIQDWTTSEAETLRDTEPTIISNVRPLYLHPAKWQSLTLKEHYDLADKAGCMSADWIDYARAIEKALKEKNSQ